MSRRFCTEVTPECPVEWTTYGYYPNLGGNVFLLILFAICFFAQLVIGWKTKVRAFAIVVAIGCGLESIGYGGRLMMNENPWTSDGFKMQVCCLILAPSFLAAGYYLTIKTVVNHLGRESSKLAPRWYTWIFIGCDIVSILTQAAGGGIASAATDGDNLLDVGNGLIMAGIAFQVATMATCMVLTLDFFIRLSRNRRNDVASTGTPGALSDPKFKFYLGCSAFGFLTIFIRCVYRLPEMAGGWGGELMRREDEFMVLDGMMTAIAAICLTVAHPGIFLPTIGSRNRAATTEEKGTSGEKSSVSSGQDEPVMAERA
ncbi:hypothetical protein MBLNU13_g11642t1 [Cladosporium sp. NU13]